MAETLLGNFFLSLSMNLRDTMYLVAILMLFRLWVTQFSLQFHRNLKKNEFFNLNCLYVFMGI